MALFLSHLFSYLRNSRFQPAGVNDVARYLSDTPSDRHKSYPRFPQTLLPAPLPLDASFDATLRARRSAPEFTAGSLTLADLSTLLQTLRVHDSHRPYPSGGSLYPIESYVLLLNCPETQRAITHYNPSRHALEHLGTLSPEITSDAILRDTPTAAAIVILTATWQKNAHKYRDFAFLLSMIEAGHIGQNLLLAAAAAHIEARPFCGFYDDTILSLLELNADEEQPIYAIGIGSHA